MEVHFLGTAGYHPNETRQTSCVMIPEAGIVLDAGTGFFRVRERLRLIHFNPLDPRPDPAELDAAAARFPETVVAQDGLVVGF